LHDDNRFFSCCDVLGPALEQAQVMRIIYLMGLEEISAVLPIKIDAAIGSCAGLVYRANALVLALFALQLGYVSNYLRQAA
tara:strand:- start:665 stop:907 length:243 start_codon:yes stop_codon:yes gene_type:complete